MKTQRILAAIAAICISSGAAAQEVCINFEDLDANTSVDAREGVVLPTDATDPPYLEIWPLRYEAKVVETGVYPLNHGAPSGYLMPNNCLENESGERVNKWLTDDTAKGFADVRAGNSCTPQEFGFTFGGALVDKFSIKMFDFGDHNPLLLEDHQVVLQAYDENGDEIGDPDVLSFSSEPLETPRESEFGDLYTTGDACTASDDMSDPGYHQFVLEHRGMARVELTMLGGYDPRTSFDTVCLTEHVPDCETPAVVTPGIIWPPNHKMVPLTIDMGDGITVEATEILQDEPVIEVSTGKSSPDGQLDPLAVRAERAGSTKIPGDGRVYRISFTAIDETGLSCKGEVSVCVPHDQASPDCIEGELLYDSTAP